MGNTYELCGMEGQTIMNKVEKTLLINEIYESISGEAGIFPQGTWCTIIRFQGCNLQCDYCDTKQSWSTSSAQAKLMTIEEIVNQVKTKYVMITGGEPLLQPMGLNDLVVELENRGKEIQIETNGSLPRIWFFPYGTSVEKARWVVDYKLPSSGQNFLMPIVEEFHRNWYGVGVIKFVVATEEDMNEAMQVVKKLYNLGWRRFLFSPVNAFSDLIPMIMNNLKKLPYFEDMEVVISLQIHKLVNMK